MFAMRGKMSKLPFSKVLENIKQLFDCIVSDVCGPMRTASVGKSSYFITFIDAYTEVEFLRTKDEAAQKTVEFIEKLKTQLGKKPKIFRSDRGGEYLNDYLQNFLKSEGIISQCTVARNPQQNGIAERKNRTLMEAARTLLISSDLPNKFWAEAIHHANETFNMINKEENVPSPYEIMFEKSPNYDFHTFGCKVYLKIPDEIRKKLDEKAELMQYLGPDKKSKGHRVLNSNGAVKISRDVKFVENL